MPWKEGFPQDAGSYKKHDWYKKTLEETIEEKVEEVFETKMCKFVQNLKQQGQLDFTTTSENATLVPKSQN